MITIAVDAMGGDNAPRPEVEGSVLAARELGVRVMLVGQPPAIRSELGKHDRSRTKIRYADWGELVAKWRDELGAIGRGFAEGDARVDPKRGPLTCGMCDQHTFCRIAEKGSFGVRKGDESDE